MKLQMEYLNHLSQHDDASAILNDLMKNYGKEIWNIVMRLPVKYREIILLEAHYAYTEQEMSTLLEVPVGTIKSRLHRARSKVEQAMKEADWG
jgi:RNA polymerase sigma-70 factor (ECF subfamily)